MSEEKVVYSNVAEELKNENPLKEWNGKGLPDTGSWCYYSTKGANWLRGRVMYKVVGRFGFVERYVIFCPHSGFERVIDATQLSFKSKREHEKGSIKREQEIAAIEKLLKETAHCHHACELLHEKGLRVVDGELQIAK